MSYTPTTWATGDVITADKLNNMEDGIVKAGSVYPVGVTVVIPEGSETGAFTLQKTFGEIKRAIEYGSIVIVINESEPDADETLLSYVVPQTIQINTGGGGTVFLANSMPLEAQTDNDYPTNSGR